MSEVTLSALPLIFTFRDVVEGAAFKVCVVSRGRVLAAHEDEGWWFYGVRPGAIAAGAVTGLEVFGKFREGYRNVLADLAAQNKSLESFTTAVQAWFNEGDERTDKDWTEAVAAVRAFGPEKLGLNIKKADAAPMICLEEIGDAGQPVVALAAEMPELAIA